MTYAAPLAEMRFVLDAVCGLDRILALPGFGHVAPDLLDAVFAEGARLAETEIAPLEALGDAAPPRLADDGVRVDPAFRRAYAAFRDGGWNALAFPAAIGGQDLPWCVAFALQEMWQAASLTFGLCPLLNQGAIELLATHGDDGLRARWLPRLVSGEWTGVMALTEPQAGSDLGAVRCRATPRPDGSYALTGSKIFITWGEHDLADNILHFVLARLPDAPDGSRGLSLFLCPRILSDGSPNDVRCTGLEHKLGLHGSPTCAMSYGDRDGATAWLVGAPGGGLSAMFTMMNNARLSVGLQGIAAGERALQRARRYAAGRVQGRGLVPGTGTILDHPDIRRMLLTMRALTESGRALAYAAAAALDRAGRAEDPAARQAAAERAALLTPIVKSWGAAAGVEAASLGVQIHGGAGYVEESGAARLWRDARILPIYEGTNEIQALDLVFRKLARDGGRAMRAAITDAASAIQALVDRPGAAALAIVDGLTPAVAALTGATERMVAQAERAPARAAAGAAAYAELAGLVLGGGLLARGAAAAIDRLAEPGADRAFLTGKIATARFHADHLLPRARGLAAAATGGQEAVLDLPAAAL